MENPLIKTLLFLTLPLCLAAHVEQPEVVAGSATFTKTDAQTQLIKAEDKTVINCKTFHIGKNEKVRFEQPHDKARVLCRVTGKEASILEGHLEANGRLFLINPNSIVFRPTAQINVKTLVASTLDIKDADFADGRHKFALSPHAKESAIVNHGTITADNVVFMAPQIVSEGIVRARLNRWSLGGEVITLNFDDDNLISFAIDAPLQKGFIIDGGQETAADVFIKLNVAQELVKSVVNVNGLIEATNVRIENGKVYLVAGSSQTAKSFKAEGPLIETAADFTVGGKIEMTAEKELKWSGGAFTPVFEAVNNKKFPLTELSLNVSNGLLRVDGPIEGSKSAFKALNLTGKTIDQNNIVGCSGPNSGPITYTGEKIFLGGDIYASNKNITFNGAVIVDHDISIKSGPTQGDILFNSTLDADQPKRSLTINNGQSRGSVSIKGSIGLTGPLNLKIETGKLSLPNIGDKSRAGVGHLELKAKNKNESMDFTGTILHAGQQTWEVENINLTSGQLTTFITDGNSMIFTSTKINLDPHTSLFFETHGGNIELPSVFGDHQQSITLNIGHGDAKIGALSGDLGHLHVQSRNIYYDGGIEVKSAFMEAQDHICYAKLSKGENFKHLVVSKEDMTLNAKRGMVGTEEMPINIDVKGKIYAGSKSFAYLEGKCRDGFPSVYKNNPPPRTVFNKIEVPYVVDDSIFAEEVTIISLTPDLSHAIPKGFVNVKAITPRLTLMHYQAGEKPLITSSAEQETAEAEPADAAGRQ
jgi:filamentous hemagglutinin family protein